jgi:hypothetical protein
MFVIACLHEEKFDFLPPLIPQSLLCIDIVVIIVVVVIIIIIINIFIIIRGQILVFEFGSQTFWVSDKRKLKWCSLTSFFGSRLRLTSISYVSLFVLKTLNLCRRS